MYIEALVTFVDILGFKDIVEKKEPEDILKILEKVKHFNGSGCEVGDETEARTVQFSDSIIRVRPFGPEHDYGVLYHELSDLVFLQGELIHQGVFIRGGIAMGKVYLEGNTIFGPAFNRAYELESRFANYPRIVLDHEIFGNGDLRSKHNSNEDEDKHLKSQLRQDGDGLYFVDYLKAFLSVIDDLSDMPVFIEKCKELILENIKNTKQQSSVLLKYLWLAKYYNEVVQQGKGGGKYLISSADCSILYPLG